MSEPARRQPHRRRPHSPSSLKDLHVSLPTAPSWDAIVVGARCAGAPTAMLLARKGYRVLLVERARIPSDTMRNHFIQQGGIGQLQRWGLLERLAGTGCPPIRSHTIDFGDFPLTIPVETADGIAGDYGPRRYILDGLLATAAGEAGADVRDRYSVRK